MDTVLDIIIRICTAIGDAAFAAMSWMGPVAALWFMSAVLGVAMMLAWRCTSNQKAIAEVRRRISADLLATRLFKDNLAVTFRSQRRILWQAVRLLGYSLKPTLIMIVPFVLIMSQIGLRYEFRPAAAGSVLRVTATVKPASSSAGQPIPAEATSVSLPAGVRHNELDPCRAELLRTVDWRFMADSAGSHLVTLGDGTGAVRVPLVFGEEFVRLSSRVGGAWHERLLFSAEPALPADSAFESVRIHYPARRTELLGFDIHWLISLFGLSIGFALLAKPVLKVHI